MIFFIYYMYEWDLLSNDNNILEMLLKVTIVDNFRNESYE
jgi:hypothetical protein